MSNKMKICIIDNMASLYRAGIYKKIDDEFECEWYFGRPFSGIKGLPLEFFKHAEYTENSTFLRKPLYRQSKVSKLLHDKRYDAIVVIGEITNVSLWWGMLLHKCFFKKPKVFYWTHGMLRVRKQPRLFFDKVFYHLADEIFTYGDKAKEIMVGQGFESNRIHPIHNSLDYDTQVLLRDNYSNIYRSHFKNNNYTLLFIGRLTKVKKLHMIIDAIAILNNRGLQLNCVYIGDGPVKDSLQKLASQRKVQDQVWFYGPCYDEKEKSILIANADLCVAPGNIGLTAMDSLVYGTPAITMDNFGKQMPEHEAIKDGITGTFFKEDNVEDLAGKIEQWFADHCDRNAIRENCYKEIDEYWTPEYQMNVLKEFLKKQI